MAVSGSSVGHRPCTALTREFADGHPWRMEWTATTPIHVQLIALYAILNHDPAVALSAAAAALGAPPPGAEPGKRYPAG